MTIKIKKFINSSFYDHRGYYWTNWQKKKFRTINYNHDKFSLSKRNVLRGIHGDKKTWKLVSCPYGKLLFVVVNCVRKSKNYLNLQNYKFSKG